MPSHKPPKPSLDPRTWQPPRPDLSLRKKRREIVSLGFHHAGGEGPEDAVVDAEGRVITGLADGRIMRLDVQRGTREELANTGGRPLGIEVFDDGSLLVCDANRGLLKLDPDTRELSALVTEFQGVPLTFCNNAAIARDGRIFFSDSSRRFGIEHWRGDLLEHSATGRLFQRDPDGKVTLLLDGLKFANGVALSADESFVAVAETSGYRVQRYYLQGPRAGTHDMLIENLHGFPDNIARGSDGLIWITQASPRDPALDALLPRVPWLRKLAWAMPDAVLSPKRTVWVIAVDDQGQIVHDLQGTLAGFSMATGVREHQGTVYLGSLLGEHIVSFVL